MAGLIDIGLRRHRPQRLLMILGMVVLFSLLLGATASAQQGPTPPYVHVYLDKVWANSQGLPSGLQNFTITGTWSAGPGGPSSTAVCQYVSNVLNCTYSSTITDPNYPGGFDGIGLVVPYGQQYTISESGLPAGWQAQTGIGSFTAAFNQYCDFSYEDGAPTDPDDDCLHTIVNAQTPTVEVIKTANTSYTRTYAWEIAKSVSPSVVNLFEGQNANVGYTVQVTRTGFVDSGWAVNGVISVTNNSAVAVTLNSVTDSISGVGAVSVNCPATLPTTLGAGATLVCTYSSALPNGNARTNTATATYNTNSTATGAAAVTFGDPTTVVSGTVSVQDVYNGGAPETIGTNIAGNTTIPYTRNVVCGSNLNYVNGVATYNRLNTATIVETNQSANATMTVNCYRPSVSKTVDPDYTRRFTWQIVKTVTPSQIDLFDGQSTTATYTVTLTKSNPIDENFRVFGDITITNPNPNAALNLTGVTDQLSNGLNATVTCPSATVPAGGSLVCTYETNVPNNADGANTATVTTTLGTVYTSPVVPYTFVGVQPSQTTLNSVTVTDTNPATGQPWTFSSSGAQSYQLPFACVDITYDQNGLYQTTVNNTAVITQTGQQSTALVNLTCRIPTATISSVCTQGVRTWTITANYTGAYEVEFLVGGNVQSTTPINLVANTPANITYNGDPTTLSGVRVTFNGNVVASESGPYADCTQIPTASLSSVCVNNTRTWTVNVSQSGAYVVEFLVGGNVQSTTNLSLTANTPQTFTYSGDPTTLSSVRVTFNGSVVASESGPYESCTDGVSPSVMLTPVCTDEGLIWRVTADQSGSYVAQIVSGGNVIETVNLTLTANTPQTFAFIGDSTTPNSVRIIYQNTLVLSVEGPEPCVSGLSAALTRECTRLGVEWTVFTNRSGEYVAQLMLGETVIESINLTLTESVDAQFVFQNDSSSPRYVRLLYQGNEYARLDGLDLPCSPTALPPSAEPQINNFVFLPTVTR